MFDRFVLKYGRIWFRPSSSINSTRDLLGRDRQDVLVRVLTGSFHSHSIDTVHALATKLDLFSRGVARQALIALLQAFNASVDICDNVDHVVKVVLDVSPSIFVMHQVDSLHNNDIVLVSYKRVLTRYWVTAGMIKAGNGNKTLLSFADTLQVTFQRSWLEGVGCASSVNRFGEFVGFRKLLRKLLKGSMVPVHGQDQGIILGALVVSIEHGCHHFARCALATSGNANNSDHEGSVGCWHATGSTDLLLELLGPLQLANLFGNLWFPADLKIGRENSGDSAVVLGRQLSFLLTQLDQAGCRAMGTRVERLMASCTSVKSRMLMKADHRD
mmetsp:Transcript_9246/g.22624  ORF Transcript_9246/g.22624 Transcript_9246/m.22624 type:complete len:329 (-) Transcript_9246:238-1224(-)